MASDILCGVACKRFIMANVLVALSIVGTAIGLLFTDYPSWWHGVWFGAFGLSVLLSFIMPPLVEVIRPARNAGEAGWRCRNTLPSGRPACMALPLDGCPCNAPARNAGEVDRG